MNLAVTYKPLWKLLIDKELKKSDLRKGANLSPTIIAKMTKEEYVSLKTLESICIFLECSIEDVVEIIRVK